MEIIKDSDFKEKVIESRKDILVYFYSPLQVPCLLVENSLENLEKTYAGKLDFFMMDINEGVDTCLRYGVLSVPKMIIFRSGEPVATRIGSASSAVLEAFIKAHI